MSIYKKLTVRSSVKDYTVNFSDDFNDGLNDDRIKKPFIIIDRNVARLYRDELGRYLKKYPHMIIRATEPHKSLAHINVITRQIIDNDVKRGNELVAIGGGIIQDITGFIASILYRGMDWVFYPTTLLAQADSCIGSKTSINVDGYKNQVGNFYPPRAVFLNVDFLKTLSNADIRTGLGEIIKVHLLDGRQGMKYLSKSYGTAFADTSVMSELIMNSLKIKKRVIEKDEFDTGYRNIMNYGHTFGHALESVTGYRLSHGQAVTVGMDISNYISWRLGHITEPVYREMENVVAKNLPGKGLRDIDISAFFRALTKDKKNIDRKVMMILTRGPGRMFRDCHNLDKRMKGLLSSYFAKIIRL